MEDHDALLQQAVESLFEDERLRSNLTDAEAAPLLAWGESRLGTIAGAAAPVKTGVSLRTSIEDGLKQIRTAILDINDLVSERDSLDAAGLRARLTTLVSGQGQLTPDITGQIEQIVLQHKSLNGEELVKRLTQLLSRSWEARPRDMPPRSGAGSTGAPPLPESSRPGPEGGRVSAFAVTVVALVLLALGVALPLLIIRPAPPAAPSTSPAGGWYQVYFTSPRFPDKPADHTGSLDERLTAFIDGASASVDMAIYQLDLDNVTQAVIDAKRRGAAARVVTDIDILEDARENPSFKQMQAEGITVVGGNPNAIMHDKFVVVDGKAVWTGSWNFTENDTYRYNNNGVLLHSPDLARNYTTTFEKMWLDRQFGRSRKPGGTTPVLTVDSTAVESYFAPEDKVAEKIVARLAKAERSIDFMAFSFTEDQIGEVVLERAEAGVRVRGVFETTGSQTQFSEYGRMKAAGIDVLQDGNPYLMHHKVFIIDGETVIAGSFNFSQNADTSNDENLLIVADEPLALQFAAEFDRVYSQARNPPQR